MAEFGDELSYLDHEPKLDAILSWKYTEGTISLSASAEGAYAIDRLTETALTVTTTIGPAVLVLTLIIGILKYRNEKINLLNDAERIKNERIVLENEKLRIENEKQEIENDRLRILKDSEIRLSELQNERLRIAKE